MDLLLKIFILESDAGGSAFAVQTKLVSGAEWWPAREITSGVAPIRAAIDGKLRVRGTTLAGRSLGSQVALFE